MSDGIREDEWIKVIERLPNINEEVEVYNVHNTIQKAKLMKAGFNYCWVPTVWYVEMWRHIQEKKPDFSKLNRGDLLLVHYPVEDLDEGRAISGHLVAQDKDILWLSSCYSNYVTYSGHANRKINIKKIIRINIENQTFEEI